MARIALIALLICSSITFSFAQDSLKKTQPAKPALKAKPYKYRSYGYHHYKADSPIVKAIDTAAAVPSFTDKSLNGQYQYLLTKVYHYQQPLISALWKNASDTLNLNRSKLKEALIKLNAQNKMVDSLKNQASERSKAASTSNDQTDVLGIALPKTTYNFIVWGLIAVFGITALVLIVRSGSLRREARYRTQLYNELEEDFKVFKTKANDKEKKLARELQTERNKLDDLLGRG